LSHSTRWPHHAVLNELGVPLIRDVERDEGRVVDAIPELARVALNPLDGELDGRVVLEHFPSTMSFDVGVLGLLLIETDHPIVDLAQLPANALELRLMRLRLGIRGSLVAASLLLASQLRPPLNTHLGFDLDIQLSSNGLLVGVRVVENLLLPADLGFRLLDLVPCGLRSPVDEV
jgi:hypothetical protein